MHSVGRLLKMLGSFNWYRMQQLECSSLLEPALSISCWSGNRSTGYPFAFRSNSRCRLWLRNPCADWNKQIRGLDLTYTHTSWPVVIFRGSPLVPTPAQVRQLAFLIAGLHSSGTNSLQGFSKEASSGPFWPYFRKLYKASFSLCC